MPRCMRSRHSQLGWSIRLSSSACGRFISFISFSQTQIPRLLILVSQKRTKQIKPICIFVSTIYNGNGYWWSSTPRRCVGPIALVQRALLRPQLCDQHLLLVGDGKGRWSSSHRGSSSAPDTVTVTRGGRVRRSVGIWNARHGLGVLCPRPSPQPRPTERWSDPFQRRPKSHVMRCLWRWWADILGRRQWWRQWRRPACR